MSKRRKQAYLNMLLFLFAFNFQLSALTVLKKINSVDHNFKIEFAGEPTLTTDTSTVADETLITYYWELNITDTIHPNCYYSLSLSKYPSSFIHSDSVFSVVEGFINSTQNSIQEDKTFTLLSSTIISINGYPGKIFKWKNTETNKYLDAQVFLVESRLFEISVVTQEGQNHNNDIKRFFESFELVNLAPGNYKVPEKTIERSYSIKFPVEPKEEMRLVDSEVGKLELDIQMLETKTGNDNMVYIAMETRYPKGTLNTSNEYELNALYKKSIDASLNAVNGELISITDIVLSGKAGKEYKCYFSEGAALMVYRILYIEEKLYTFGVITLPSKDNNKAMKDFFKSFKLKEN